MRNGRDHYRQLGAATAEPRETEIVAFRRIIGELETAEDDRTRVRAFGRNHDLWATLVRDLALTENQLPQDLKTQLIALGFWSMNYSVAGALRHLPAEPAIAVNRNVLEGLLAQSA